MSFLDVLIAFPSNQTDFHLSDENVGMLLGLVWIRMNIAPSGGVVEVLNYFQRRAIRKVCLMKNTHQPKRIPMNVQCLSLWNDL